MADTRLVARQQPGTAAQPVASAPGSVATGVRRRAGVWQRFRRHRVALVGAIILFVLSAASVGAPLLPGSDPYKVDISAYRQGPRAGHLLGTDSSGRDVLSRLLYAGRVSLSVGLVAVTIYTVIGIVLGSLAGFYGGWV